MKLDRCSLAAVTHSFIPPLLLGMPPGAAWAYSYRPKLKIISKLDHVLFTLVWAACFSLAPCDFPCCCAFSACPQLFPFLSPFLLLPGPSAFSRLLVSLLVSPSPPRRCAVSVCHSLSPLVFFSSLFLPYCRILCPPSRGWSGLVFLLVFHFSSASLFVSFVSCQEPSETWLSA